MFLGKANFVAHTSASQALNLSLNGFFTDTMPLFLAPVVLADLASGFNEFKLFLLKEKKKTRNPNGAQLSYNMPLVYLSIQEFIETMCATRNVGLK